MLATRRIFSALQVLQAHQKKPLMVSLSESSAACGRLGPMPRAREVYVIIDILASHNEGLLVEFEEYSRAQIKIVKESMGVGTKPQLALPLRRKFCRSFASTGTTRLCWNVNLNRHITPKQWSLQWSILTSCSRNDNHHAINR